MIYYIPRFQLATLTSPQTFLRSKIGGVPWGLSVDRWPRCCDGELQKLVGQLLHEPPMLDLGDQNGVLLLFQCEICGGIGFDGRGRGAFIIGRDELGDGLSTPPGYDVRTDSGRALLGEAFIEGWEERDDCIPQERLPEFFEQRKLWRLQVEHPEVDWFGGPTAKFGGSPRWTGNGPMGWNETRDQDWGGFEFLFQIDEGIRFEGDLPEAGEVGCRVMHYDEGREVRTEDPSPARAKKNAPYYLVHTKGRRDWHADWINLGTDGTLFVFINRATRPHAVRWFWNR